MTPTVSVILNCYNHESYIGEAIESVLGQSYRDFELIIIDNGSTDASRRVIQSYADDRIRMVLHDSNASISRRLNEGIATARGEFVSVLYSDDMFLPQKLLRQVQMFENLPREYGVVYAPALRLNQLTGRQWHCTSLAQSGEMYPRMLDRFYDGFIDMCSPLVRRECYVRYPFHDDLFADGEMIFFRIGMRWRFHFDLAPVVVLREHGSNIGRAVQKNHDMMMEMWERLERHADFPARYIRNLRHLRAIACRNHAWIALRYNSADRRWITRQISQGLRAEPWQLLHARSIISLLLTWSPAGLRAALNRIADSVRGSREEKNLVHDY